MSDSSHAGLEPLYALILERDSPCPVAEIGRLLAAQLPIHPTDAIAQVRYGGGLIAKDIQGETADRLSGLLEELGVRVRKVGADEWGVTSPGHSVFALEILEEVLLARLLPGDDLVIPREEVFGLDLYALPEPEEGMGTEEEGLRRKRRGRAAASGGAGKASSALEPDLLALRISSESLLAGEPALSLRGRRLLEKMAEPREARVGLHLTLCCSDPVGPLRLRKDKIDFSCLGQEKLPHSIDNFLLLLEKVLAAFPGAWGKEKLERFLSDLDPVKILYYKKEEVTRRERWMLQWIRIELEERARRPPEEQRLGG
jgi:hypothetical protein